MAHYADEDVWAKLRATRSAPPAPAACDGERRQTYVFSLEQAEQLFHAATAVGTAVRPVPVFYALSQAGRAIAAASSKLDIGDRWRLQGHGIHAVDLRQLFPDIGVYLDAAGKPSSFVTLSELLDSPLWIKGDPVPLHRLWDTLPENRGWPLRDDRTRRTPLYVDGRNLYPDEHPLLSVPVCYFPPWLVNSVQGSADLVEYMAAFPEATGYEFYVRDGLEPGAAPRFERHVDGWGELQMSWVVADGRTVSSSERSGYLNIITRRYRGRPHFFPAVANNARRSLHPLMAWWAVLYTLSMLARYQPAEWAKHINVDNSPHAVPVERLLETAIDVVPRLIAETIDQVAGTGSEASPAYG